MLQFRPLLSHPLHHNGSLVLTNHSIRSKYDRLAPKPPRIRRGKGTYTPKGTDAPFITSKWLDLDMNAQVVQLKPPRIPAATQPVPFKNEGIQLQHGVQFFAL